MGVYLTSFITVLTTEADGQASFIHQSNRKVVIDQKRKILKKAFGPTTIKILSGVTM